MSERALIILTIIIIILACIVGGFLGYVNYDSADDEVIEQEKERLYELEKTTTKDLETLMGTEDISIDISSGDKIKLTFLGTDCELQVTYNKNYEIIEETFVNYNANDQVGAICLGIVLGLLGSISVLVAVVAICLYAPDIIANLKRKRKLKQKAKIQKQEENEIKVIQL